MDKPVDYQYSYEKLRQQYDELSKTFAVEHETHIKTKQKLETAKALLGVWMNLYMDTDEAKETKEIVKKFDQY